MGTWGTAISSNDTYADIYADFFNMYNDGLDVDEISQKLITTNTELINDIEDANNFWFGLAKAQWECKKLDETVYIKVKSIIESGNDLDRWQRLDATFKDIKKRTLALHAFLEKITTEKEKPRARRKKKTYAPAFETGCLLTFQLNDRKFGGVIVLDTDFKNGYNLLAVTCINNTEKPSLREFRDSYILLDETNLKPILYWYHPLKYKVAADEIEIIGKIVVEKKYDVSNTNLHAGFIGDFNLFIIDRINSMLNEGTFNKSETTVKNLIKKSFWKF